MSIVTSSRLLRHQIVWCTVDPLLCELNAIDAESPNTLIEAINDSHTTRDDLDRLLAAITRHAIAKIGYFDQNFFPAYFEDSDYSTRMRRAGLGQTIIKETLVEHARSSTLRANTELRKLHTTEFTANKAYFGLKWGDYQSPSELFEFPFDDENISYAIDEFNRAQPYPGRGRTS